MDHLIVLFAPTIFGIISTNLAHKHLGIDLGMIQILTGILLIVGPIAADEQYFRYTGTTALTIRNFDGQNVAIGSWGSSTIRGLFLSGIVVELWVYVKKWKTRI